MKINSVNNFLKFTLKKSKDVSTFVAATVDKKSCSISFNFYNTQRYGPKNRILLWNLFWDRRGVA